MRSQRVPKLSIRKNDMVVVISGSEKAEKASKVLQVNSAKHRIYVEKRKMVKRHVRASQDNPQGGILEKEGGIHYSNVLLFCPKCNRGVRHGHKFVDAPKKKGTKDSGKQKTKMKVRVCRKCDNTLEFK